MLFRSQTPWKDLKAAVRQAILYGTGEEPVTLAYSDGLRDYKTTKPFEGVIPNMERRWRETDSSWMREELSRFQSSKPCDACHGDRLKPEALAVKIAGLNISQVADMAIDESARWFSELTAKLTAKQREIAQRILKEINARLGFLVNVGLEYLTDRKSTRLNSSHSQQSRMPSSA